MNDTKNITIGLLIATAVILTVILIGLQTTNSAYADASVKGNRYVMVAGQASSDMDLVYVIDIPGRRVNSYGFNTATDLLEIGESIDLRTVFGE